MLSTWIRSRTKKKGFFSYKGIFLHSSEHDSELQRSHLNSELSRNQRPGTAASPRKKSLFFERWRGSCWGERSRSHETQTLSPNLCLWWGEALALGWCWNQVGWMTPPHLNPREQLLEELRVPHTPLPPTCQLAREQAQGKGTAAITNWSLPPPSPSKKRAEVNHHSLWSPALTVKSQQKALSAPSQPAKGDV